MRDIVLFQEEFQTDPTSNNTDGTMRVSQDYLRSVSHLFEPDALHHLLNEAHESGQSMNQYGVRKAPGKGSEDDVRQWKTVKGSEEDVRGMTTMKAG